MIGLFTDYILVENGQDEHWDKIVLFYCLLSVLTYFVGQNNMSLTLGRGRHAYRVWRYWHTQE
jgi:hypothetical protein